jgi:hypothetical protein
MTRTFINEDRTVAVQFWNTGEVTVMTRETPMGVWSPPIKLVEVP